MEACLKEASCAIRSFRVGAGSTRRFAGPGRRATQVQQPRVRWRHACKGRHVLYTHLGEARGQSAGSLGEDVGLYGSETLGCDGGMPERGVMCNTFI